MRALHDSTREAAGKGAEYDTTQQNASGYTIDSPYSAGEYLTVSELCDELRISPRTAYYLLNKGDIPHVRVGRSIRIYRSTLERWRRDQEEHDGEDPPGSEKKKRSARRQPGTDPDPR